MSYPVTDVLSGRPASEDKMTKTVPCPDCTHASGQIDGETCRTCRGFGEVGVRPAVIDAAALKQARVEWGMTQVTFAELLGVNLRTYQGYEQGRAIPDVVAKHVRTIQKLRLAELNAENESSANA